MASFALHAQVEQDTQHPFDDLGAGAPPPPPPEPVASKPVVRKGPNPDLPPEYMDLRYVTQEIDGDWVHLRGAAEVETTTELMKADEIDYNKVTGQMLARGNVHYNSYVRGETLEADHVDYSTKTESGRFYGVKGTAPAKGVQRAGQLNITAPFIFEGEWAERIGKRYILHKGFITNCRIPNPWWVLKGGRFDIIPGERALAYQAWFRLKRVPLFYAPVFYKSLDEEPRKSGFLTPNLGTSNRRGYMIGAGYYWAISRSYDATYRVQYFTLRGLAHHVDLRGKLSQKSDFNVVFYGVNDKLHQGGYSLSAHLKSDDLPWGFHARADINYLSSFIFRQNFTESFNEAIYGEIRSTGSVIKQWSYYSVGLNGDRAELYNLNPDGATYSRLSIRRLPAVEFQARDQEIHRDWPIWISLESSAALLNRTQPLFETRKYVDRLDIAPRISTALHWGDFHLLPYATIRETHYGEGLRGGVVTGDGVNRTAPEYGAEVVFPAFARIFAVDPRNKVTTNWLGDKLKHVIEPRAGFRDRRGLSNFGNLIRFDDTDILTATREVTYSLTQRLYAKKNGKVREIWNWQVMQKYYLDPTFGGTITGPTTARFVIDTETSLTGFSFLNGPRRFSPVVSSMKWNPSGLLSGEWRADYDPVRQRFINSSLNANFRRGVYFASVGQNQVRSDPTISPQSNQLIASTGVGKPNAQGWSAGFSSVYDFRAGRILFATAQASYNSNCCGLSVQFRRLNIGTRDENQYRVAFSIANIGSFGTLRRQDRIF